ncbi:collagen alpha-1(XII) chain-like [Mercenaria mercenaria]|uniref:collagen alpha-1(XII) chain-like n=1 Tax=Mercenaria mercenaria TaxID=6596 RepID=UPI00234F9E5A|nr:collagen alpha-1(XII) chain-like [Mercenaria mercenaria]
MLALIGVILVLVSGEVVGQPVSSCNDLDEQACLLFQKAKPDLCSDPTFSQGTCKRFCGNCPLECYACPTPVLDPDDCNTTISCGSNQTCMTKHLKALDGHDEYIMMCEKKEICEGLSLGFAFGKRGLMFDEETEDDVEEHDRNRRDVTLSCCDTNFCNMPTKTTTTTLPPTSPGPFPHGCNRDIIFVLDDSGSVGTTNFRHALDFVRSIVQQIEVGPTKAQIGLLSYSTHPQVGWYLNRFDNKVDVMSAVNKVHYLGGVTHTNEALETVRTQLLTPQHGDRSTAENVVLVLTDGQSNNHIDTIREANQLHQDSKDVISIVIGSGINTNELNAIATDNHHVFDLRSYNNLSSILPQLMQIICNA